MFIKKKAAGNITKSTTFAAHHEKNGAVNKSPADPEAAGHSNGLLMRAL